MISRTKNLSSNVAMMARLNNVRVIICAGSVVISATLAL